MGPTHSCSLSPLSHHPSSFASSASRHRIIHRPPRCRPRAIHPPMPPAAAAATAGGDGAGACPKDAPEPTTASSAATASTVALPGLTPGEDEGGHRTSRGRRGGSRRWRRWGQAKRGWWARDASERGKEVGGASEIGDEAAVGPASPISLPPQSSSSLTVAPIVSLHRRSRGTQTVPPHLRRRHHRHAEERH
ncbi:hypothetical protein OsJ_31727 [Oryza sativa Japonica Group]|uniref:Uncharacterized protein n=1 Tax=Oryza sativa subsp. japonica TaxID=39947 RepID=B9G615_ORYSJ|nr:hypothetical protein OsJ_31727 [Oryza sativa Japonica Group]